MDNSDITMQLIQADLSQKASIPWVESKIENVDQRIRNVARMPHECNKGDVLSRIEATVESWSSWWRGAIVTLIAAIVILGGALAGWFYSHQSLKENVDKLDKNYNTLETSIRRIESSQETLQKSFENIKKPDEIEAQYKDALRSVLTEFKIKQKADK